MAILQRAIRVLPAGGLSLFLLAGLAQAGDLTVVVTGVAKAEGQVMVALFNDPAGFPRGKVLNGQMTPAKPGAPQEFGGMLANTRREGNTLSMVIRQVWDSGSFDPSPPDRRR